MWSDNALREYVIAELADEPALNAAEISVSAKHGIVTLAGYVNTYTQKWLAEKTVKRIYGVKGLAIELEVRLPPFARRSDPEIAEAALNALRWNSAVPQNLITLSVEQGWITLDGSVDWKFQKDAAEHAVRDITGVNGVTNLLVIKPRATPADVKQRIETSFERNAILDARHIDVRTQAGKVILSGKVRSWAELEEAQRAAWGVPGVCEVENDLLVTP